MPQFRQLTRTATSTRHPTQGKIHTSRENATYTKGDFSRVYFQNVRLLLDAAPIIFTIAGDIHGIIRAFGQSGGTADTGDLKSPAEFPACGFESRLWHHP